MKKRNEKSRDTVSLINNRRKNSFCCHKKNPFKAAYLALIFRIYVPPPPPRTVLVLGLDINYPHKKIHKNIRYE
jgi:hypothetical protein